MNYAHYIQATLLSNAQNNSSPHHNHTCPPHRKGPRVPTLQFSNWLHQMQVNPEPVHPHPSIAPLPQRATLLPIQKLLDVEMRSTGGRSRVPFPHNNTAVIKIMLSSMLQKQQFWTQIMPNQQRIPPKQVTKSKRTSSHMYLPLYLVLAVCALVLIIASGCFITYKLKCFEARKIEVKEDFKPAVWK